MMEFLRFILSDFWVWLGFVTLVYIGFDGLADLVRALRRPPRKVTIFLKDKSVTVESPFDSDIRKALNAAEEVGE